MASVSFKKVTIASGQKLSGAADLLDGVLCALHLPAVFSGTSVKFKGSRIGSTAYNYVKDSSGTDLEAAVAAGTVCQLDPSWFLGLSSVKVESQAASEAAARDVYLGVREY
jgi:hypothetical protein